MECRQRTCLTPQRNIIIIIINSGRRGYGYRKSSLNESRAILKESVP
nr:MAG TPA: hypothetical protein [Caudoviricetes sp.]